VLLRIGGVKMSVSELHAWINDARLAEAFRAAMRRFASTVSIISCNDPDGQLHGMSATAVTSVCADPPTVLVCVNNSAATHGALSRRGRFCINILRSFHSELSQVFSGKIKGHERFCVGNWITTPLGRDQAGQGTRNLDYLDRAFNSHIHFLNLGPGHHGMWFSLRQVPAKVDDQQPIDDRKKHVQPNEPAQDRQFTKQFIS
jgi:Flavin reductase like domain